MTGSLETLIALAATAHCGQVDKTGAPYILHPLRVMLRVIEARPDLWPAGAHAAILHDVVEDTHVTLASLGEHGVSDEVVTAVQLLTRAHTVTYDTYIQQLEGNPLARAVKIADLEDNLGRNQGVLPRRLRDRYTRTLARLQVTSEEAPQ